VIVLVLTDISCTLWPYMSVCFCLD